ncbi:MAG: hypothetical protein Q7J27_01750 [Syntrophales bacterium]|nr:hypothetical protein [Syntrophales bacterium]
MVICVAVDNSVLGDLTDTDIPENKKADKMAFEEMIELARQGVIEIGVPLTAAMIEEKYAGEDKHKLLRKKMGKAFRLWPVVVTKEMSYDIENKKKCLHSIMQDREGVDSANLSLFNAYNACEYS